MKRGSRKKKKGVEEQGSKVEELKRRTKKKEIAVGVAWPVGVCWFCSDLCGEILFLIAFST